MATGNIKRGKYVIVLCNVIVLKAVEEMRQPYQVLVIPYRKRNDSFEYAIFKRRDMGFWQWISGGGEDFDPTLMDSARREAMEEANISRESDFLQLNSKTTIPVVNIAGKFLWGDDIYVIPEYSFAVSITDETLRISEEHSEFRWVSYTEAIELLKFDSNKTALWELDIKLRNKK